MTTLLRPLLRPQALGLGLGLSSYLSYHASNQRPLRLDSSSSRSSILSSDSYQRNAKVPLVKEGRLNARAVRQISAGSVVGYGREERRGRSCRVGNIAADERTLLGLCAGLAVSTFSRSLALIFGLLVVGVQYASNHGINLVPYERLQKLVTRIDLRSAIHDNVAFKISFGTTFALAAFMHF
ncbi:hypothetical protein BUE80_DR012243 [Diplocarpon rosae]|nr:hypothetical protein BUE80_DR012243 [Diplocarpon rosae]